MLCEDTLLIFCRLFEQEGKQVSNLEGFPPFIMLDIREYEAWKYWNGNMKFKTHSLDVDIVCSTCA